jgi:hypothetical protein
LDNLFLKETCSSTAQKVKMKISLEDLEKELINDKKTHNRNRILKFCNKHYIHKGTSGKKETLVKKLMDK